MRCQKKKKRQKAKNAGTILNDDQIQEPYIPTSKNKKSSADILEEMFGLKINLPEPQETESPQTYSEQVKATDTWDPAEEYDEVYKKPRSDYQKRSAAKKTQLTADRQKHKAFNDKELKTETPFGALNAKILFSKKANLKDYIKIQEILNKPKALRR